VNEVVFPHWKDKLDTDSQQCPDLAVFRDGSVSCFLIIFIIYIAAEILPLGQSLSGLIATTADPAID
jgi:ascorbate-specific PTS system EIIC-type component UlaA